MAELDFNWLFERTRNEQTGEILKLIKTGKKIPRNVILQLDGQKNLS